MDECKFSILVLIDVVSIVILSGKSGTHHTCGSPYKDSSVLEENSKSCEANIDIYLFDF